MRADRLVAIVLLLQIHGQRTAGQLAEVLETSERTIRRDLDALGASGIPVYPQRGRGGGWALVGGYRTDLTGLTAAEATSLVLAATGLPDQPGIEAALRKILAALPEATRQEVAAARSIIHVDPSRWRDRPTPPLPREEQSDTEAKLQTLRTALIRGVGVDILYGRVDQDPTWRRVGPRGLVLKAGTWYLVAMAELGLRTYRVSRISDIQVTGERSAAEDDFDLGQTWHNLQQDFARLRPVANVAVRFLVDPDNWQRVASRLRAWWNLSDLGPDRDGWRQAEVTVPSVQQAVHELVVFGDLVEVLQPAAVRQGLADFGRRLVDRYADIGGWMPPSQPSTSSTTGAVSSDP
jgi:predicted DNA-binding transcriptional regulator YafY